MPLAVAALVAPVQAAAAHPSDPAPDLLVARFARLALACVHQEYPNKISHVLSADADVRPPRELTPAFYGCYDWHSSVHGHWLLARIARQSPESPQAEVAYLEGKGRVSFERPYGLAWLLQLAAELREWTSPEAKAWAEALAPLERAAAARI